MSKMSNRSKLVLGGLAVAALSFAGGFLIRNPSADSAGAVRKPLYYHDPMHPAYRSDKPGIAPDCGMQLEAVYADVVPATASQPAGQPGAVKVSFEKQQIMGVQTAVVRRSSRTFTVRAVGRVVPDETRVQKVTALSDGIIRVVSTHTAGTPVHADDLLATYFVSTRDIYSALQSYFVAMTAIEQGASRTDDKSLIDSYKAQLRMNEELLKSYGVTETQLREVARTRQVTRDIEFRSPISGLILSRNASIGQRVERGTELFRIADLTKVWILADVFEKESGLIQPGTLARVRYRGQTYPASTQDLAPQFDPASRTLKLRVEVANSGNILRPDMFVDVEFEAKEPEGISVPVDALLDSGFRKAVFVSGTEGLFEPREVMTGKWFGDRVQIVKGLSDGETIATSGLFLLDSESRLQLAAAAPAKPAVPSKGLEDPVCGMSVSGSGPRHETVQQGITYRFCSKDCKSKFDANPSLYTGTQTAGGQKKAGRL